MAIAPPSTGKSDVSYRKYRQQGAPDGLRTKTARGALITSSLPTLQNLIKRSSDSYAEEFAAQWARFGSLVKIVQLGLGGAKNDEENLREVTGFVCQVAHLYPSMTGSLPSILTNLLLSSAPAASTSSLNAATGTNTGISGGGVQLNPETRKTMMQGLVLLRRRDVITGVDLLKTLFPLLSLTTSPNLRAFILKTILGDIKHANQKTKNHKLNRMVQGLLFGMIDRGIEAEAERTGTGVKASRRGADGGKVVGAREAMWAVKIARELWRKHVWRDAQCVAIVARATFHPDTKVQSAAMHFFLVTPSAEGAEDEVDSDEEDGNEGPDIRTVKHRQEINKKRKSTERRAKREIKNANSKLREKERQAKEPQVNFSALELLHDPQTFAERLYQCLVRYDKTYTLDHKVLVMTLFGRACGLHKLHVLAFYSYILKYLTHHQLQITLILVALAESVHDLTPPDELEPVIRKLAAEFVHGGVAAEVNAAGLNAITEICRRQPWCMDRDLLEDLVSYKKSKDKGVMVASRGLLSLFREVNPGLLKRGERGKVASMKGEDDGPLSYGQLRDTATGIEGLDLLAKHLAEKEANAEDVDSEEEWKDWEVESDGSDSSGGWNDVSSEGEDFEVTDSSDDEDEVEARRKRRKVERGAGGGNVVDVAGTKADDVINFGSDSEEDEDSDDEREESDDEGEEEEKKKKQADEGDEEYEMSLTRANKLLEGSTIADLALTKILTPADFVKINELRTKAAEEEAKNGGGGAARRKLAALQTARKANLGETDNFLTEGMIIGVRKKTKDTYEERLAKIAEGREGREKFGSNKHKKLSEKDHSTTNEEKRRKKAFAMVAASRNVRKKNTASLQQKSKKLRNHINRIKKGGRRGNSG
ncbi:SDA1-domain-containing protein [Meredithblackwellia eburnea MCA 4105]